MLCFFSRLIIQTINQPFSHNFQIIALCMRHMMQGAELSLHIINLTTLFSFL